MLTFSLEIKKELSRIEEIDDCCKKYELAGLMRAGISLRQFHGKPRLLFITENASLSRHVYSRVKELYKDSPDVFMLKTRRFRSHTVYQLEFTRLMEDTVHDILEDMGIIIDNDGKELKYKPVNIKKRCCRRAYLRGCFLATGSISDPDRSYHLEITFPDGDLAEEYIKYSKGFEIEPKQIMRKGHTVIYLKEGQEIVDFLNVIGAHVALMKLENIRIVKDMRNQVNRIVNCETANLEKTVNAAIRQIENIRYIAETRGLDTLPLTLREIAKLRLENPDVSLSELGQMLNPALSKSGVNHRLKRIDDIAENLRK